ncbi:MAG TPA: nucleotide sugar dehydrogenase [Solirubrobacteraceae bacterium]
MTAPGSAPTRIAVVGLWHLGAVIAAVLADAGNAVSATDSDAELLAGLRNGQPAVAEPGLAELIGSGRDSGALRFVALDDEALREAEIVWIAADTPVGDDDVADPQSVIDEAFAVTSRARPGALVIVSSQLPVGSIAQLERRLQAIGRDDLAVACMPENLRLGQAIETFRAPERFVVGVRDEADRARVVALLGPFGGAIEWMRVESAEMTKHALNAFLATSIAFINEIATVGEEVGADAEEVSRGLMGDRRIGPGAYLRPGGAFAGGTLARDLQFLAEIAGEQGLATSLLDGVRVSNRAHEQWSRRVLRSVLGDLAGRCVGIWGLTYKPGTDTLRRSSALSLCEWLLECSATVTAHDPVVSSVPLRGVQICATAVAAASDCDALVIGTPWPEYRGVDPTAVLNAMSEPVVLDPSGFLARTLGSAASVRYLRVGAPRA